MASLPGIACAALVALGSCAPPPVSGEPRTAPAEAIEEPPSHPAVAVEEAEAPADAGPAEAGVEEPEGAAAPTAAPQPRVVRFSWKPARGPDAAYAMEDPEDRHQLVLMPGIDPREPVTVVVGFHGQPARGRDPRDYWFTGAVREMAWAWVREGRIRPFVLVLPVFRFVGGNWPGFDPKAFLAEVEVLLEAEGLEAGKWFAFGHSGAAGCGGDGLNRAFRMAPFAVAFLDTCIGRGFTEALRELDRRKIPTLVVHSVETAGFTPRQSPEYQSGFDFGRAFEPAGLAPVSCPTRHPGTRLRPQKWKCAASPGKSVKAFVVDTGEGKEAHQAVIEPGLWFFLEEYAALAISE